MSYALFIIEERLFGCKFQEYLGMLLYLMQCKIVSTSCLEYLTPVFGSYFILVQQLWTWSQPRCGEVLASVCVCVYMHACARACVCACV